MTGVAREILGLLSCLETQKNGRGVTLLTLSELWRGTKAKSHTKFLNTDTLTGYGNGSKYSKHEVDTIAHAMVFENIVEEISEETGAGFAADYVKPGPKAHALLSGQHQFFVRFAAKKAPEQYDGKKKASKSNKDDASKQENEKRKIKKDSYTDLKEKRKGTNTTKSEAPNDVPHEFPDSDLSDGREIGAKRPIEETILPKEHTEVLLARIKKLVTMWAEEVGSNLLFVIV
jgi:superfamily II DNA helicase RecQ